MAIEYRALALEMMATLRVRTCKSYRNGRCAGSFSWVCDACSRTVKLSEAKAFLETKGIDLSYDQDKILETMNRHSDLLESGNAIRAHYFSRTTSLRMVLQ